MQIDLGPHRCVIVIGRADGRVKLVEDWLQFGNERKKPFISLGEKGERIKRFVDLITEDRKAKMGNTVGLGYRDVVLLAGMQMPSHPRTADPEG